MKINNQNEKKINEIDRQINMYQNELNSIREKINEITYQIRGRDRLRYYSQRNEVLDGLKTQISDLYKIINFFDDLLLSIIPVIL